MVNVLIFNGKAVVLRRGFRPKFSMMVELLAPGPREVICDPACGTGGFLVAAAEYVRELKDSEGGRLLHERGNLEHFNRTLAN